MRRTLITTAFLALFAAHAAIAAPGLGEKVYSATVEPGVTEFESRYGRLTGGQSDGEDALKLELEHAFSRRFAGAVFVTLARDPTGPRRLEEVAFEGVIPLARVGGVDIGTYVEYSFGNAGPDALELKALFSRTKGRFDGRLNLIAEKPLDGSATEFGYAASADWRVIGDLRAGFAAFGEAGELSRFLGRHEHYAGPVLKTDLDHVPLGGEIEIEAGYLFALPGAARDRTDGQVRLLLEWERKF